MSPIAQRLCRLAAAAAVMLCAATLSATAEGGPFSGLNGQWTGAGHIKLSDGTQERIRCRASYTVGNGGTDTATSPALRQRQLQFRIAQRRRKPRQPDHPATGAS